MLLAAFAEMRNIGDQIVEDVLQIKIHATLSHGSCGQSGRGSAIQSPPRIVSWGKSAGFVRTVKALRESRCQRRQSRIEPHSCRLGNRLNKPPL